MEGAELDSRSNHQLLQLHEEPQASTAGNDKKHFAFAAGVTQDIVLQGSYQSKF